MAKLNEYLFTHAFNQVVIVCVRLDLDIIQVVESNFHSFDFMLMENLSVFLNNVFIPNNILVFKISFNSFLNKGTICQFMI